MGLCWQSDVFAFNILYRFVYSFPARSNHLISWLQSQSPVILELKKRKSVTASTFPLSMCHEVMGCHDLQFSLVVQSCLILVTPWSAARLLCQSPIPRACSNSCSCFVRYFVGKVMSLLFNMMSRLVIAFLPRSKHLLISWLQSPFEVILEPKKIKFLTVSIVSPSVCHEGMGPDAIS